MFSPESNMSTENKGNLSESAYTEYAAQKLEKVAYEIMEEMDNLEKRINYLEDSTEKEEILDRYQKLAKNLGSISLDHSLIENRLKNDEAVEPVAESISTTAQLDRVIPSANEKTYYDNEGLIFKATPDTVRDLAGDDTGSSFGRAS